MVSTSVARAALFQRLHRLPTGLNQSKSNCVAVSWSRAEGCIQISVPLRASSNIDAEINRSTNGCSRRKQQLAQFRLKLSDLDSLTNELHFFQFTKKPCFLHVGFFARSSRGNIQSPNSSLCHCDEVLRCDASTVCSHSVRAISNPNRNADCTYCSDSLNPAGSIRRRQYGHHAAQAKGYVHKPKRNEKCEEGKYYPIEQREILGHRETQMLIAEQVGAIVGQRRVVHREGIL